VGKLSELWKSNKWAVIGVVALILVLVVCSIYWPEHLGRSFVWILVAAVIIAVGWFLIDFLFGKLKKLKQRKFDDKVAAKEGIDERKDEWSDWTSRMSERGIDRYDLPFYLLVGEPQSGKSVMLHNSDLHFPFGTSRLSGPGGTRGCDWWFTDEAVILDLAGRLFTHEGGASDEAEWAAFLGLLSDYRPLSPANGIILVIPCDSLLGDSEEKSAAKAAKIKDALLTLVTKLQAQLPIYVVLTKADKVFGFAETVHRLGSEKRREMFGWSRPADQYDKPFSPNEFRDGFEEVIGRAQLLRARSLSEARIPDALGEVDRLYAFPDELRTLQAPLEIYLNRIFKESNLVDLLFFRGVYISSGLQKGAPIAQACANLIGTQSEQDSRALESLFAKQKAYFIRDLVRERVFAERGLVRPTSKRVHRSRKITLFGYGTAALLAVIGTVSSAFYFFGGKGGVEGTYEKTLTSLREFTATRMRDGDYEEFLGQMKAVRDTAELTPPPLERAGINNQEDFRRLYRWLFEGKFWAQASQEASTQLALRTGEPIVRDYADFRSRLDDTFFLLQEIDLANPEHALSFQELVEAGTAKRDTAGDDGDEKEDWNFKEALATYMEYTKGEEESRLLTRKLDPLADGLSDLQTAAQHVDMLFDELLEGKIHFGGDKTPSEEQLEFVLRVRLHVRTMETLYAENKSESDVCVAAERCEAILASIEKLRAETSKLYYTAAEEEIWGAPDSPGLDEKRELLRAAADINRQGSGLGRWEDLKVFRDQQLLGANSEWIRFVRDNESSDSDNSYMSRARSARRPSVGSKTRFLGEVAGETASLFGGKEGATTIIGRITLIEKNPADLLRPFRDEEHYRKEKSVCDDVYFKPPYPWGRPNKLSDAIDNGLKSAPDAMPATVAPLYTIYREERFPTFTHLADGFADEWDGTSFHVDGLMHLVSMRSLLERLRKTADEDSDGNLALWVKHLDVLYSEHLTSMLGTLSESSAKPTLDADVVEALCAGSQAGEDVRAIANRALSAYVGAAKAERIDRWTHSRGGWNQVEGLDAVLEELEKFLEDLEEARARNGCAGEDILGVTRDFRTELQTALEAQVQRLSLAIDGHWNREMDRLRKRIAGGDVLTSADAVFRTFGPKIAEAAGESPDLAIAEFGYTRSWPRVKALADDFPYLFKLMERDDLMVEDAAKQYQASGLAKAVQSDDLRRFIASGDATQFELLSSVLSSIQIEMKLVAGPTGSFWDYCREGIGLFTTAAQDQLRVVYGREFGEEIAGQIIWRERLFEKNAGTDWGAYEESPDLLGQMDSILHPFEGRFAKLKEKYDGADLNLDRVSDAFSLFLTDLTTFLYGQTDQPKIDRVLHFELTFPALTSDDGTVWGRQSWWPAADARSAVSLPRPEGQNTHRYSWHLKQKSDFAMFWGPARSPDDAHHEWRVTSELAPLLIAWHYGDRSASDTKVWDITLDVKGEEVRFQLKFDGVVPVLPSELPD
jgi:hypothetical protein